jgi:predicted O-methyltransferase YrrM
MSETAAAPDRELATEAITRRSAHQKLEEFAQMISLVRERQPRTVVEIGTHEGGTLFAWCQVAHPEATLVSIDLPGGLFGGGYSRRQAWRFRKYTRTGQTLRTLRRDSQDPKTVARLQSILRDRTIDFLMIDGDHSYEGVKRDWDLYEPLVSPGGLIAFHDILEHPKETQVEVSEFWNELAPAQKTVEFTDPSDERGQGQWGGIGVVFKQAPSRPDSPPTARLPSG